MTEKEKRKKCVSPNKGYFGQKVTKTLFGNSPYKTGLCGEGAMPKFYGELTLGERCASNMRK
ncbi:MAG: hypothetical protein A2W65_01575 [Candidatus Taylorbacteria bacterium RIFCSPLOWO2_02_50_13]|nr:MAG: hypothetical protein A3B27_01320 [Candidatus Taylorbacteria bacterium RIFCSPLOWO2_01_FULL_50_130]OHA35884.1 MAG: hypothetical protein A2W65_01575 [Candidatus Taylorbacteria bacterium RIFCSPLOWO2_02_50_13]